MADDDNMEHSSTVAVRGLEIALQGAKADIARLERVIDERSKEKVDIKSIVSVVFGVVTIASSLVWFVISSTTEAQREALQIQLDQQRTDLLSKASKSAVPSLDEVSNRMDTSLSKMVEEVDSLRAQLHLHETKGGHGGKGKAEGIHADLLARMDKMEGQLLADIAEIHRRKSKAFDELRADLVKHADSVGHDGVTRLMERVDSLEDNVNGDEGKFESLMATQAEYGGKIERALLLNEKVESRVGSLEDSAQKNERSIAKVAAMAEANFVEVESQMRGLNAVFNSNFIAIQNVVRLLGGSTESLDLGEWELHISTDIPAKATTTPGKVSVNGG